MSSFPDSRDGDNWTVAVFKCPRPVWVNVLSDFFTVLESHKKCMIPHYTIRFYDEAFLFVSFRVLRGQQDEEYAKSVMARFLGSHDYEIDPVEGNRFYQYHAWMKKGQREDLWTEERCVFLSRLSKFVLEIIDSETGIEDRVQWGHLFSNMMAVFEHVVVFDFPESADRLQKACYLGRNPRFRLDVADYLDGLVRELVGFRVG